MQVYNNVPAFNVWANYTKNVSDMRSSMSKLASGLRITTAGDDPAGLAMSERMRSQIRNSAMAEQNIQNEQAYLRTADSWMQKMHDMLHRMSELAVSANDGTKTDPVSASLAPGERQTLSIPFASKKLWDGNDKNTGTSFASDRANKITISIAGEKTGTASLTAESLVVNLAPAVHPDWLGKRPPVEGSWKMTFQDEFNGTAIDTNNWSYYGENYWDKMTTHFSKETTYVKDGTARLRLEKKRGHHNDDPSRPESDYATGFLETYGKFTQRYGYFEARMKLPTAPGLWPAFWMMPDRGGPAGTPQWQRSDTKNGGMEFDIMEHLTRWGVNRYSIANHWNGYGKEHQANGTSVYYTPDQDGFITSGVLWTPGEVVYFCQGREIGRWKTDRIMNVPAHIIFTLPSGGWDNDRLDDSKLPGEFLIDYVRVWQRADLLDK